MGKFPNFPSKPSKLEVDGLFGEKSVRAMQKWLKCKYRDGEMSGQLKSQAKYIMNMKYGCDFGLLGSHTVKLLQRKVGAKADGYLGKNTIKALQKYLNKKGYKLDVDGYAGKETCKAFQFYLNKVL